MMLFPWQQIQWDMLWERKTSGNLPHALLFTGQAGLGKKVFATRFAKALLCQSENQCEENKDCQSCALFKSKAHPDLLWIEPESTGQIIKIDFIREAIAEANTTALLGSYRIIIIHPADAMNRYSANSLLKILEEPPANTLFILLCEEKLRLLATIRSRCQRIEFNKPDIKVALEWLKTSKETADFSLEDMTLSLRIAEGAPLKASAILQANKLKDRKTFYNHFIQLTKESDALALAINHVDYNLDELLASLLSLLQDTVRFKMTAGKVNLINSDYEASIAMLATKLSMHTLFNYIHYLQQLYAKVKAALQFNRQLLLEDIFIRWVNVCS